MYLISRPQKVRYTPTAKGTLYPDRTRYPISRPQKVPYIPTAKGTLYPDRNRYPISRPQKGPYIPTAKGTLYPNRTRYPISRPQKVPYIPTAKGTLYPDRNRYPISRPQKVRYIPTAKGTLYPDRKRYAISQPQKGPYIPTAKGICSNCRKKLVKLEYNMSAMYDTPNKGDHAEDPQARKSSRLAQTIPVQYNYDLVSSSETPIDCNLQVDSLLTAETPGYQPYLLREAQYRNENDSLQKLNDFLATRDCSPVRYCAQNAWSEAAERTKREHLRKIKQGIIGVIQTIAPGQEDEAWKDLSRSGTHIGSLTGIAVKRYDFSEPQAGKGPCDRSSAHQKAHVNRCLNEGNDIISAEDIKKALELHGGVKNVVPYVIELPECTNKSSPPRIQDISLLHNYQYSDKGLRMWKAFDIGEGKLVSWQDLDKDGLVLPLDLRITESGTINDDRVKQYKCTTGRGQRKHVTTSKEPEVEEEDESGLFNCPEPG
ncbi:hypothetical protein QZH41_000338 [Actinostola sp. cb2023]|nr:hypothetical protein QZH41_000338 [Actinostola sp. cb2023]